MKKLLTIVISVVLGVGNAWAVGDHAKVTVNVLASPNDGGNVSRKTYNTEGRETTNGISEGYDGLFVNTNAKASIYATPTVGYDWEKWTKESTTITALPTTRNAEKFDLGQYKDEHSVTYTAHFKPIITLSQPALDDGKIVLTKASAERASVKITITTFKTETLTATLSGEKLSNFSFANDNASENTTTGVGSATGEKDIEITVYEHDASDGDEITLTLNSNNANNKEVTYTIIVKAPEKAIFTPSSEGAYTVTQSGTGTNKTLVLGATENAEFYMNGDLQKTFTLSNITPKNGYRFYGVKITKTSDPLHPIYKYYNTTDLSAAPTLEVQIAGESTVEALFIPTTSAMFIVRGENPVRYYSNMDEAFSKGSVVVLHQGGSIPASHYTIPASKTLVIPASTAYQTPSSHTLMLEDLTSAFYEKSPGSFAEFRRMIVTTGTTIDVHGNVSVEASKLTLGMAGSAVGGLPAGYGVIEMNDGTQITFKSGSKLGCYGYIINTYNESVPITVDNYTSKGRLIAESGANIYEAFFLPSWRGGTAILGGLYKNSHKVFPIGQYYVQNIEVPITMNYGVVERLTTGVEVSEAPIIINMDFITPNGSGKNGLFRLGKYTALTKYYDAHHDRLIYMIEKKDGTDDIGTVLSYMYLPISVKIVFDIDLDLLSSDYVLPIPNNYDVYIRNSQTNPTSNPFSAQIAEEFAFLPTSTLTIEENCKVILNSGKRLYIYDNDQRVLPDGSGYHYGGADKVFIPITKRPDGMKFTRTEAQFKDAELVVDGELEVNGALYTTAGGGAIKSNANGKILLNSKGGETQTHQYDQSAETFVAVPLTESSPWLLNGDGSYVENTTSPNTYTYTGEGSTGKWLGSNDAGIGKITKPNFPELTLPALDNTLSGNIVCELLIPAGTSFTKNDFTVTVQTNQNSEYTVSAHDVSEGNLIIPIAYTQQNIHGDHTLQLVVTSSHEKLTELNQTINVVAVENYTPAFDVNNNNLTLTMTGQIQDNTVYNINLVPHSNNITTLTPGANATISYGQEGADDEGVIYLHGHDNRIQWTAQITNDANGEFSFEFGQTTACLSDAKVIFSPKTLSSATNDKTATLTLTATYKESEEVEIPMVVTITLKATATKRANTFELTKQKTMYVDDKMDLFTVYGGNTSDFDFVYDVAGVVDITKNTEGHYIVDAKKSGKVKVTISQPASETYFGFTEQMIEITVLDQVNWNWSTLYYGYSYENPITTSAEGWTLALKEDQETCNDLLTFDAINKTAQLGIPATKVEDCQATFVYTMSGTPKEFIATLSPARMLDIHVEDETIFGAVEYSNTNVSFVEENTIEFASTNTIQAVWAMQFVGVPDQLTFTPIAGTNFWTVEESTDAIAWSDVVAVTQFTQDKEVVLSLQPTTRYIRFTYSSGDEDNVGKIKDVRVSQMSVKADVQKLYIPIYPESNKTLVLTHTSSSAPQIVLSPNTGLTCNLVATTDYGTYYKTEYTLSATTQGSYTLTAKQGENDAIVNVIAYNFPLTLPVASAEWIQTNNKEDYFYRYSVESGTNNVGWNEDNAEVIMQFTTSAREVVFAFKGAPNRISFTSSATINTDDWEIYESVDGDFSTAQPVDKAMREVNGTNFLQKLGDESYNTRYIKIKYTSANPTEIRLTNLIITGDPNAIVEPEELRLNQSNPSGEVNVTAINLHRIKLKSQNDNFHISYNGSDPAKEITLAPSAEDEILKNALGDWEVGVIPFTIHWVGTALVNEGLIEIVDPDDDDKLLATVKLLGSKSTITYNEASNTGIWTGVPATYTLKEGGSVLFDPYTYHEVDITNAFTTDGTKKALFDYLFIYGETTTKDGNTDITIPTSEVGSNAKTPYYIYKKSEDGMGYDFVEAIEDANTRNKAELTFEDANTITDPDTQVKYYSIKPTEGKTRLSIYMTGFCPYATTGSTKYDEGVWYIQGGEGQRVDIYLEDCHIYSRNKTENGRSFSGKSGANDSFFTEGYVRGSGAVFAFEWADDPSEDINNATPFEVTITTRGKNLLKSSYGSFFQLIEGMRAYQVSSPVQIHLKSDGYVNTSKVTLNFDNQWPVTEALSEPTNGFISLQKQHNNAPSIDLGNELTTVNFNGGQVELQNAQIVSPNYKTTLAISHRSGEMGGVGLGIRMAYGIGTDAVGGTVNFYDGTTTVQSMKVDKEYRQYYLMDTEQAVDENGVPKVDDEGNPIMVELSTTSCLRCPTNTFIYGGSHCMIRSCNSVTSRGGAPTDGISPLGKFEYTLVTEGENKDVINPTSGLVTINPANFPSKCFLDYYAQDGSKYTYQDAVQQKSYGLKSVTPKDNKLQIWLPALNCAGDFEVTPETDALLSTWRACMTEIGASYAGRSAKIGGNQRIRNDEQVKYLLYCQLDENIHHVISEKETVMVEETDEEGNTTQKELVQNKYAAPVVDPTGQLKGDERYLSIRPTLVGEDMQYEIENDTEYKVTNRIYYITTAMADVWMNFTMPFDVQNIYIVESYSEDAIESFASAPTDIEDGETKREATMRYQAKHNADFASFFGVAMALGSEKTFQQIYEDYIDWAMNKADKDNNLYKDGAYVLRGKYPLTHYDGTNFKTSNFYLYKNQGTWNIIDGQFAANWQIVPKVTNNNKILMEKGQTYAMLFPYCQGCDVELDEDNQIIVDSETQEVIINDREYWDYWSGKFIIFESTEATENNPHIVAGSNYLAKEKVKETPWIFDSYPTEENSAVLVGNSTFSIMRMTPEDRNDEDLDKVYVYDAAMANESFYHYQPTTGELGQTLYPAIVPTTSLLLAHFPAGQPLAKRVLRNGEIIGDNNQGTGTGNMPTVGGGNDMFITAIDGGINIAVAAPQVVRVLSSTGSVIFAGTITTATDVLLPTSGIYIISGENEVQKILF